MKPIILASSSRYRQAQLASLGLDVPAIAPDVDETPTEQESAQQLAMRLAQAKARAVAIRHPEALVIGSDQVACVEVNGQPRLLGKPGNFDNAVVQLQMCQGKTVNFYTAVCVHSESQNLSYADIDITQVHFRPLSLSAIKRYVRTEEPYDCAGSFKSEGKGILLFDAIDSRDPNSLIGLPVLLLRDLLAQSGVDLLELATR
ncbi:septum formation protein Maf [Alteromonas aestuariivivens]|uniref:7-methyl-GTP pyrophosphatase n=1 Tax=Alteromonas aestuariivivens TaxID=1938339 RepID=A0A3D8MAW9_9ALTE|nr:nucleoside triphosphate pyrophosphatase [Alteromonas aestuariivivens]RDV27430.1 septum formation protein Maf [Alteromonas aestuariivivens]